MEEGCAKEEGTQQNSKKRQENCVITHNKKVKKTSNPHLAEVTSQFTLLEALDHCENEIKKSLERD